MTIKQTVKKFFEPALALKWITGKAVIFSIVRTLFNLSSVVLIQRIIEALQNNNNGIGQWLIIYSILFIFIMGFFSKTYDRWRGNQIHQYDKYIQNKYLRKILLIENNAFEKVGTGKFIGAIKGGTESRSDGLTNLSYSAPSFVVSLLFSFYLAYSTSLLFFLGYFIIIVTLIVFVIRINGKGLQFRKHISELKIIQSKNIVRLLMSKFEIINSGKIDSEIEKSNELCDELNANNRKLSFYTFFTHEGARAFLNIMKILLICFIYFGAGLHGVGIAQIIGFIVVLGYVDNSLQDFAVTYKQITKKINDIEKLWEFEELSSISSSFENGNPLSLIRGSISLSNITYGYNKNNPIFSEFSLSLQAKKKTALVGPSGGGKSTLIKLIAGYLRPDEGEVIIDNQKLSEVSLSSYYKHIGYLTQEPSVFDGTVRENLEYGITQSVGTHGNASDNHDVIARNEAERNDEAIGNRGNQIATSEQNGFPTSSSRNLRERIGEIITLAKCERIYELPQGLDTEIGERGVRLSGGQKQRLAIAKIMLKNPKIILLDEPTSALDSYNEEQVTLALNNLFKDKTVIVIAHRLQTVKHADEIIYISDGTITERGNHKELLAIKGEYYKMVELQSGF